MFTIKFGLKISESLLQHQTPKSRQNPMQVASRRLLKVAVVGASGSIGRPLSLLLKQNRLIRELALHDIVLASGVTADLSHICTPTIVKGYNGEAMLTCALKDADIVVVPALIPRTSTMSDDEWLCRNANIVVQVVTAVSKVCPESILAIITSPLCSLVPIAAELLKFMEIFDPNRLFGVTKFNVIRARTVLSHEMDLDNPNEINLPVIGGDCGKTILPIISQCSPQFSGSIVEKQKLIKRIQRSDTNKGDEEGKGISALSMAYSAASFIDSLLRAMDGQRDVVECAYVQSDCTELEYFSTPLLLGRRGIRGNLGLPQLDDDEEEAIEFLMPILCDYIEKGKKIARYFIDQLEQGSL